MEQVRSSDFSNLNRYYFSVNKEVHVPLHKTCFVVALALLGGCNQVQSGASQKAVLPAPAEARTAEPAQEATKSAHSLVARQASRMLESKLKKGMAYADFRKLAVDAGWTPVVDPECKPNVIGGDYVETCAANPELDSCRICDHLPELSSCSGDAYCGMYFSNDSQKLHVVTFGDFSDWDVTGAGSQLSVESWDFSRR